ncbi:MAG: hypothetical protein L3K17_09970 [Thermoplasmata archaeon]|nr:hypothetical protein [Thermoplasmata archaeon]
MPISQDLQEWLLGPDSDPSVRWLVETEVLGRPQDDPGVVAARGEIGNSGWAAKILRLQLPGGQWDNPRDEADELYLPKYIATNWRLLVLADLGLTHAEPHVRRGAELLLDRVTTPDDWLGGSASETCFTGNAVRMLTRFGYGDDPRVQRALAWLLEAQKSDGGWHCFPSETGTLDGWEPMSAFAAIPSPSRSAAVRRAIERGAAFYLDRGLWNEGDAPYAPWLRLHYPVHYYYDLLVGLDMLTALGFGDDPRLRPALDLLESKRRQDGRWLLDALHPDIEEGDEYSIRTPYYPFALERPGGPSRWITARALTVLRRASRS